MLTRARSIADPLEIADPNYAEGLRAAISMALGYGFAAIENSNAEAIPIPTLLLSQARLAARSGVELDTVLRRYFAGYTLFGDCLVQAADEETTLGASELQILLRGQAVSFDRLIDAVSEEYAREVKSRPTDSAQRRVRQVRRLLAGELLDGTELDYELDASHLGLVADGEGAFDAVRALARSLDLRPLLVPAGGGVAWAWLGGRKAPHRDDVDRALAAWPVDVYIAVGEPSESLAGWRLTHRQALAAMPIAQRGREPCVRYADVALLASALQDDLLVTSLRRRYLQPLAVDRDNGVTLRATLRAYFSAERNLTSTAAALGVNRHTVASRIQAIEKRLGQPIHICGAGLELAISLAELDATE